MSVRALSLIIFKILFILMSYWNLRILHYLISLSLDIFNLITTDFIYLNIIFFVILKKIQFLWLIKKIILILIIKKGDILIAEIIEKIIFFLDYKSCIHRLLLIFELMLYFIKSLNKLRYYSFIRPTIKLIIFLQYFNIF